MKTLKFNCMKFTYKHINLKLNAFFFLKVSSSNWMCNESFCNAQHLDEFLLLLCDLLSATFRMRYHEILLSIDIFTIYRFANDGVGEIYEYFNYILVVESFHFVLPKLNTEQICHVCVTFLFSP